MNDDAKTQGQVPSSAAPAPNYEEPAAGGSYTRVPDTGALVKNEPAEEAKAEPEQQDNKRSKK